MKYILMDLDGTLTNPKLGITKSVQYALKQMNIYVNDLDTLCKYIGPPLRNSFMEFEGLSEEEAEEAVKKYREYFEVQGLYENEEFDGMKVFLEKLYKEDKKLIVATSKPEIFAKKIIDHFDYTRYFTDVCGATMDLGRSSKEDVIRYALDKNNIRNLSEVVMIGDRKFDIIGAKTVGISSIGVLYGFGSYDEIKDSGADYIAADIHELYEIITNHN